MARLAHSLDVIFRPQSIAVVGASGTPGSVGSILMRNLMANPFGGIVYPVNPHRKAVHGVLCYPEVGALPEAVDLAIIATPAATVPGIVRDCVHRGIRGAIIISAGFAELGSEGRKLEAELRSIARSKMRLLGPNCLGVLHPSTNLNASFASGMARKGHVALLSQSGAICASILDWAESRHIGFSSFVSVGSMVDVDFADLLDYFADDPATRSIILYMESAGEVRRFISAARAVSRTKQVIVVKAGRHEAGARAAASHTGAMAVSDEVLDAAFHRAGVLRVATIPELFDMSEILGLPAQPRGPHLAIITNAGGCGVMATDALMLNGGVLAELGPTTRAALNELLPPYWSHGNPIDVLGDASPERYRQVVELCARDDRVDGLLVLLTPQAMTDPTGTAHALASMTRSERKPLLACWLGGVAVAPGREILGRAGIPTFDAPEAAVLAFQHMVQYRRNQELLYETPEPIPEAPIPDPDRVQRVINAVWEDRRTMLSEAEGKELLAAYGIPVTRTTACHTEDEAVVAACRIGYPVVVKLLSSKILHKSDVGGVQLNLGNEEAVRLAYATIRANVAAHGLAQDFEGVTVQPMLFRKGFEVIVGSSIDAQVGPVILFGAGGTLVEVFKDRALGLPPLTRTLARRLMERTRIYSALRGLRGEPAVDLVGLEALLVRFSQLIADFPEIQEFDINPILVSGEGAVALDARVILGPAGLPPEKRPRLAIQPYPSQYTAPFRVIDGREVVVRTIRPEDENLIIEFHASHSEHTIRMRFFSMVKQLSRDSLIRLCHLDYTREMALVAVWRDDQNRPHLAGVARYYAQPESGAAEFAIIIGDRWQRQGLGRHLMTRLIGVARERGVRRLQGLILHENETMLLLMRKLGFHLEYQAEEEAVLASMDVTPP